MQWVNLPVKSSHISIQFFVAPFTGTVVPLLPENNTQLVLACKSPDIALRTTRDHIRIVSYNTPGWHGPFE